MSPYVRKGRCCYHQKPDGSPGKKIGCSKDVATAKEYLKALYSHAPDAQKPSEKKGK